MAKSLIEIRDSDRFRNRPRVDIDFPCRVRIVSRTPKALLCEPLRKRRHGCYVSRLWVPRSVIKPVLVADNESVAELVMPLWLWTRNARPDPGNTEST